MSYTVCVFVLCEELWQSSPFCDSTMGSKIWGHPTLSSLSSPLNQMIFSYKSDVFYFTINYM